MRSPRVLEPGQSYRGWKARMEAAQDRRAHIGTDEHRAKRKASSDLKHLNALRNAVPSAVEKRDALAASLEAMRAKLLVFEGQALQHGRPHPGAMQITFDIASTERILAAANAAVVEAQARYNAEAAQQRAEAEAADVAEPVTAPKARTKH